MNRARRKELKLIIDRLSYAQTLLKLVWYDEESYFDNMPENLKDSQKGIDEEERIDKLDEAMSLIDEAKSALSDAMN